MITSPASWGRRGRERKKPLWRPPGLTVEHRRSGSGRESGGGRVAGCEEAERINTELHPLQQPLLLFVQRPRHRRAGGLGGALPIAGNMAAGGNTMGTTDPSLLASPLTTGHACRHQSLSLPPILDGDRMEKEQFAAVQVQSLHEAHRLEIHQPCCVLSVSLPNSSV